MMTEPPESYLPTAPKQRQLLALLLLNANKFVSTGTCVRELWGDDPPRTVVPTLQTYVLQLRRCIARSQSDEPSCAHKTLTTGNGGYCLMLNGESLDLFDFENLFHAAREAQQGQDLDRTADMLRKAVGVWRGATLSDVEAGSHLQAEISRLEESRLSLMEQRFDIELQTGCHHSILGELNAAASENPFNERLHAQYMLALYRAGRQAQALSVFHELQRTLCEELGLEASRLVRRLHEAILLADPDLDVVSPPEIFRNIVLT